MLVAQRRERAFDAAALLEEERHGNAQCRSCSTPLLPHASARCRRGEPALDQSWPHPRQLHDLLPRAMARNESQRRARQRERVGEETKNGLVGTAALGCLGDAHLPGIAVPADARRNVPRLG